jgi:hypothetical protein
MTTTLPSGACIHETFSSPTFTVSYYLRVLRFISSLISHVSPHHFPLTGALFVPMSVNIPEANCLLPQQVDPRLREASCPHTPSHTIASHSATSRGAPASSMSGA